VRHATALLYHVCAVASRNIRFASCGTSGKLTLWTRYVHTNNREKTENIVFIGLLKWDEEGKVVMPGMKQNVE
jgi:hypothetical protein